MNHRNWRQFLHSALIAPQAIKSKLDLQAADYADFVALAVNQGVANLLLERLEENEKTSLLPDAVIQSLVDLRRQDWVKSSISAQQLNQLIELLDENQIQHVLLKGAALAYSLYSKSYLRPRSDTDIWVKPDLKQRLDRLLQQHGFEKIISNSGTLISHQSTFIKTSHGFTFAYDIHWQISNRNAYKDKFNFDDLYQSKQTLPRLNLNAAGLDTVNALLHSCVHYYGHYSEQRDHLIWIYDLHLLAQHLNDNQWRSLCNKAIEKQLHPHVSQALLLAQQTFSQHYPSVYLQRLNQTPNELNKFELARIHSTCWSRVDNMKSDWLVFNWKQRLILFKEHVFPSAEYMQKQFNMKHKWLLPAYYAHRVIYGLIKWIKK